MGWLANFLGALRGADSVDLTFFDSIPAPGQPLNAGYCVFSLRRTVQKADYGEIPELKERFAAIQAAIRANDPKGAEAALTAFRLATIASPDLITRDARRLFQKAEEKVKAAFPAAAVAGLERPVRERVPREETLADMGLYD